MEKNNTKDTGKKKVKIKYTVSIEFEDGRVEEKTVTTDKDVISPSDMDVSSTKENFLRDFDKLEKAGVELRDKAGKAPMELYADEIKKKKKPE